MANETRRIRIFKKRNKKKAKINKAKHGKERAKSSQSLNACASFSSSSSTSTTNYIKQHVPPNLVDTSHRLRWLDNRLCRELLQTPTGDTEDAIVVHEIDQQQILRIKHGLLNLVPD
ncbi:hypothetical protein Tco_1417990 [Tanacetum coccineum]